MDTGLQAAIIGSLFAGAFGGVCLGSIAAGLFLYLAHVRGQVRSSRGWPTTPGTITSAAGRAHSNRGSLSYYYPVVSYAYQVAGRSYTSSRIAFGLPQSAAHNTREAAAAHYPLGSTVPVFYNSRNPADAVLERREANFTIWIVAGIVFVLAATVPICMVIAGIVPLLPPAR